MPWWSFRTYMMQKAKLRDAIGRSIIDRDVSRPYTVRIRYKKPYASALYLFSASIIGAIVPKHLLASDHSLNTSAFGTHPVGSGPYRFRSWAHSDRIIFDANPEYFRGAPSLKVVELHIVPHLNTVLTQLRTHEADFSTDIDASQLSEARSAELVARVVVVNGFRHLEFKTSRPPLDDLRVRRALCEAIDPKAIFRTVFFRIGAQAPADQNPLTGWADPTLHYYRTDVAAAGKLLDDAGWAMRSDGLREKAGRTLSFELMSIAGGVQPRP